MKAGWQVKTLNQIAENLDNKRIPITKSDRIEGIYPYYGASGIVDYVGSYIFDCDALLISEDGANLLARSTPIAFPASGKYWVNNHAHIIKFDNLITQRFVELYLESIALDDYITGAAQPKLNQKALNSIPIPVPPIQEQQRIVAILDQAFEGIAKARANAEQNLQNARALFESHLQSVFTQLSAGWTEKSLKEITTVLGDGLHGTPKYKDDGEYYFINGNNLNDGVIQFKENTKRVTIDEYNKHKKNLTNRTILVSINGTLGKVAFYNGEKIILGKSACYFNLKEDIDKNFVRHIFSSPYFLGYAHKEATGATIKNVSLKSMREFKLPIPSLPEQTEIVFKYRFFTRKNPTPRNPLPT